MTLPKVTVLSSPTPHHVYFVNMIEPYCTLQKVFYETEAHKPCFATGPCFEEAEAQFEEERFFQSIPSQLCREPILVQNTNCQEVVDSLLSDRPDLVIVFGTGKLQKAVVDAAPLMLNIHRGNSEEYRGLDADLWPIYHSDYKNLAVTVHKVDYELDTGDILYQMPLPLHRGLQAYQLRFYTTVIATHLITRALLQMAGRKSLEFSPQCQHGRYYSFMPVELKRICAERLAKKCAFQGRIR